MLLAASIALGALTTFRKVGAVPEVAQGCDSFGYLQMAREVRRGAATGTLPRFWLDSGQASLLVAHFIAEGLPIREWDELVAPHAHHYQPGSGKIGCQYPPGTALALSVFPEGRAVSGLNAAVVSLLGLGGLICLFRLAWRRAWISAGYIAFAAHFAFAVVGDIEDRSFSINASIIPLIAGACFLSGALRRPDGPDGRRSGLCFAAGCAFGIGFLVRLPSALLASGPVYLLGIGRTRRSWGGRPLLAFGAGAVLCGLLPVLLYQQAIAGAWYRSTYNAADAGRPALDFVGAHFRYYFGHGSGAGYNWGPFNAGLGIIGTGFLFARARSGDLVRGIRTRDLLIAALLPLALSAAYFLSHEVTTSYYLALAALTAVILLTVGVACLESRGGPGEMRAGLRSAPAATAVAIGLASLPGMLSIGAIPQLTRQAWAGQGPAAAPQMRSSDVPAELRDARAWVWAGFYTGSFGYYAGKPSFKIAFAAPRTRADLFRFVRQRGEPQFLVVDDDEDMRRIVRELGGLGARLIPRGQVFGRPYFRLEWAKP